MIVQTSNQLTAVIRLTKPREAIRDVMGPGLAELKGALARQGIKASGPWFTHHLRLDPAVFDFEIGVPVTVPVAAAGRMAPGQLPATTVARTIYHGPYEGLGEAWSEFSAWITAHGHAPGPDFWEVYTIGPESNSDPAVWCTELNRRLVG